MTKRSSSPVLSLIHGAGEMVELVCSFEWSKTSLGPIESWSEALLAVVNLVLLSPIPTALYWGPERVLLYNDGYRPFTGVRHPESLGSPGAVVWKEAWHLLSAQTDAVFATGAVTYHENFLVPIEKDGRLQDFYWTYCFSPVYDRGQVAGIFNVCQSTTDKVVAERKLRESESRAQRVLESIGDAVIATGADGRITRMNPIAEALTGISFEDAVDELLEDVFLLVDVNTRELIEVPMEKVRRLGTVIAFATDTALIGNEGRRIHIDGSAGPIWGDQGELTGIVLVFRDIGERRQMEQERARAARAQENAVKQDLLLKLLQGQRETTDPTAMMLAAAEAVGRHLEVDRTGFFDVVDDANSSLTVCWTAGELPLLSGDIPMTALGSDYLAEARAGRTRGVSDYTTDPMTRDSSFAEIGVRSGIGVPIIRQGKWRSGFYVHCTKVREWTEGEVAFVREAANQTLESVELALAQKALRRSEARARKILESIGDAVIVTDDEGAITGMNPLAEELTGWSYQEASGTPLAEVVPLVDESTGETVESGWESMELLGSLPEAATHVVLVRRDGVKLHIDHSKSPIREDGGRLSGMVLIFRDITERNRTERRLRQAYKMEALGQLTGGIAHDFNNILAIIMGNLELIAEDVEGDTDTRDRIEQTVAAAERAADLTRRLLAYARQQPLQAIIVDVEVLVHAAAEFIRRSLGPTIVLQVTVAEGLWPARIDRNQFENALLNLAVNARDAMPGGGQINIHCENFVTEQTTHDSSDMAPGEYLLLSVTDTGHGMTSEALLHATEPFFTTKPVGQGTGLGLSMVYGFVKQSGGHLDIESVPSGGTRVLLYLPRAVTTGRKPAATNARKTVGTLPRGQELVLVVEDELAILRTIGYLLNSLGYRVLEAEDGPAALVHLRADERIDLLLTDVILPHGISGPALAREARTIQPEMKVIFSSGYTSNVLTRDYSLEDGVNLLNKPFHLAELAKMVRSVLDLAKS